MKSKPGIPLEAPLGPVLTYFSVVVVIVRVGEMPLKLNRWIFPLGDARTSVTSLKSKNFTGLLTCLRRPPWLDLQLHDTPLEARVPCHRDSGWHFLRHLFAGPQEEHLKSWNVWIRHFCTLDKARLYSCLRDYWNMRGNFFMDILRTFRNFASVANEIQLYDYWKFM